MVKVRVFYATRNCIFRFVADENLYPSAYDLAVTYQQVAEYDDDDDTTPEDVFVRMNVEPETVFDESAYSKGVDHTSMSIGDIAVIDETAYVCLSGQGWHKFDVGKEILHAS